jgi:hypothetical protein
MGPRRVTIGSLSDELERAGAFDPVASLDPEPTRTGRARAGGETDPRLSRPLRLLLVVAFVLLCLFVVVAA